MKRHDRIVFVDPDDDGVSYWWPALIVPQEELGLFRATMDSDIKSINDDEQLVCYFEDGSFSVVPKTALVPFSPDHEPYTTYAKTVRKFFSDAAIVRATGYWTTGEIPVAFKWLAMLEQGRRPSNAGSVSSGNGNTGRKRSLNGETGVSAQVAEEDSESEIIDPLTPSAPLSKKPIEPTKTTTNAPPKKKVQVKPSTVSSNPVPSGKPKVVGRPKKSPVYIEEDSKTSAPTIRRESVETDVSAIQPINIPPVPKYNPSSTEQFSLISDMLPVPILSELLGP